jgi:hypothetical protein
MATAVANPVAFLEAITTLSSMFPELDVPTIRDVLDARGGHMESAVEELLAMSRAKRGIGGGGSRGVGGGYGGGDDGTGGSRAGYSDEAPRSAQPMSNSARGAQSR